MSRNVDDLSPVWLHWRRAWLEDSERRIFNVVPEHTCWLGEGNLTTLNSRHGIYGCLVCGRLHECRGDVASCPVRQNPDNQSYACAFSGRQVCDADVVIGVWKLEQMAQQPAHLAGSHSTSWMLTTSKKQHIKQANRASDARQRNREFKLADEADSLQAAAINCHRLSRAQDSPHESKEKPRDKDASLVDFMSDDGSDEEDAGGDKKTTVAVNGLLDGASRNVVYDPRERERDFDYQRRLFAPLVSRLAHLAPRFLRVVPPSPPVIAPPLTSSASVAASPTPNKANAQAQKVVAAKKTLRQLLLTMVPLFELITSRPVTAPTIAERVDYFAPIVQRLLELAQQKPLSALSVGDVEQRSMVVLMDLLASPLRVRDSEGNLLFAWVADPWLAWCKREGHLVQLLLRYVTWRKTASNTHDGRISGPSRKRKRSEGSGNEPRPSPTVCPLSEEARAAMEKLSPTFIKALLNAATNISHHGNEMRNALLSLEQAPISLYALVHADLFPTTEKTRSLPSETLV